MQALQQQAAADRRQREELFNEEIERANSQADSRVAEAESQLQELQQLQRQADAEKAQREQAVEARMQAMQQQAAADIHQREELCNQEIERMKLDADSRVAEAESQLQELQQLQRQADAKRAQCNESAAARIQELEASNSRYEARAIAAEAAKALGGAGAATAQRELEAQSRRDLAVVAEAMARVQQSTESWCSEAEASAAARIEQIKLQAQSEMAAVRDQAAQDVAAAEARTAETHLQLDRCMTDLLDCRTRAEDAEAEVRNVRELAGRYVSRTPQAATCSTALPTCNRRVVVRRRQIESAQEHWRQDLEQTNSCMVQIRQQAMQQADEMQLISSEQIAKAQENEASAIQSRDGYKRDMDDLRAALQAAESRAETEQLSANELRSEMERATQGASTRVAAAEKQVQELRQQAAAEKEQCEELLGIAAQRSQELLDSNIGELQSHIATRDVASQRARRQRDAAILARRASIEVARVFSAWMKVTYEVRGSFASRSAITQGMHRPSLPAPRQSAVAHSEGARGRCQASADDRARRHGEQLVAESVAHIHSAVHNNYSAGLRQCFRQLQVRVASLTHIILGWQSRTKCCDISDVGVYTRSSSCKCARQWVGFRRAIGLHLRALPLLPATCLFCSVNFRKLSWSLPRSWMRRGPGARLRRRGPTWLSEKLETRSRRSERRRKQLRARR
eukprot:COSAG01_NODE_525_length_15926_cov_28.158021_19_plen_685_part_00